MISKVQRLSTWDKGKGGWDVDIENMTRELITHMGREDTKNGELTCE